MRKKKGCTDVLKSCTILHQLAKESENVIVPAQ